MKLSIQVFSDTHTECIPTEKYLQYKTDKNTDRLWSEFVNINSDIVALVGDIGNPVLETYWSFVEYISLRCKIVLLVTGNHEYWGSDIETTDLLIRSKVTQYPNVRFLQRNFTIIDDTVFLGCTLWSYIPPVFSTAIEGWSGEFKFIKRCDKAATFNSWHLKDLEWIINSINQFRKEGFQIVVLTHYTPSLELNFNKFFGVDAAAFAFSSDLSILYPHIKAWAYGHTHLDNSDKHQYNLDGFDTVFISNQRGYPNKIKKIYNPSFSVGLHHLKNTTTPYTPIVKFDTYNEKYVEYIQSKVDKWIKNGKKLT